MPRHPVVPCDVALDCRSDDPGRPSPCCDARASGGSWCSHRSARGRFGPGPIGCGAQGSTAKRGVGRHCARHRPAAEGRLDVYIQRQLPPAGIAGPYGRTVLLDCIRVCAGEAASRGISARAMGIRCLRLGCLGFGRIGGGLGCLGAGGPAALTCWLRTPRARGGIQVASRSTPRHPTAISAASAASPAGSVTGGTQAGTSPCEMLLQVAIRDGLARSDQSGSRGSCRRCGRRTTPLGSSGPGDGTVALPQRAARLALQYDIGFGGQACRWGTEAWARARFRS